MTTEIYISDGGLPMGEPEEVLNKIKGYTARIGCEPQFDTENGQVKGITLRILNASDETFEYIADLCRANGWRAFDTNGAQIDADTPKGA